MKRTNFFLKNCLREITQNLNHKEHPLLNLACLFEGEYMSTKYFQNISNDIIVMK